ncbi:MAG TPA: hypothetical protein VMT02_07445 [Burkholderiales bacterium]|jgi:hypothetical protein|nr:hypothetical protein [Burkholderiales bacterium]
MRPMPALLALLAAGCASTAPTPAEKVTVHESRASVPPGYQVIKRVWVDSWQSALFVPTYASREEAAQAMREQAAALGGNGVINFACYRMYSDDSLGCNGTVVRFQ